jgi:hypothetical protein
MSLCTRNRWGTGSSSCSMPKTAEAKIVDDKLKKMMEERTKQDMKWIQPSSNPNNISKQDK